MGVWNAHTSVGNISGSLLAARVLDYGWGWSFIVPGGLIVLGGILVYLFLAAYPEDVGFLCKHGSAVDMDEMLNDEEVREEGNLVAIEKYDSRQGSVSRKSVALFDAFLIPGVIPFALSLFFSKLVAYTFLYWLPFYLSQSEIGGQYMSVKSAGNLSTLFDVVGIVGGSLLVIYLINSMLDQL
ncbi:hypothetical protein SLE2022_226190 [Rubroshorea leprosula]